jgi:hypothetical protein
MSLVVEIIILILIGFIGYSVGRISHIVGGHLNVPHHWIYGLIMIVAGAIFYYDLLGRAVLLFGIGLFISDLIDFLELKIIGSEKEGKKRFWHID